jgi:hypothetical protein
MKHVYFGAGKFLPPLCRSDVYVSFGRFFILVAPIREAATSAAVDNVVTATNREVQNLDR